MKSHKQKIRLALSRSKQIKNLTDLRTLIAFKRKDVCIDKRYVNTIFASSLSWQCRLEWAYRIRNYTGKKHENIEWLTIVNNSAEIANQKMGVKADRWRGDKNPAFEHGGKLSPFSKKSSFYNPNTIQNVHKNHKINGTYNTDIRYYLKMNLGLCQAMAALSNRQATNRLDKYISKHGQIEGTLKWKQRQEKWIKTLESKPLEERARINSLKMCVGYTVSKAERELLNTLLSKGIKCVRQLSLPYNNNKNFFVYDIACKNKIIEYNGDMWHANPKIYTENFVNPVSKATAQTTWEKEKTKEKVANDHGYTILRVWESDYKQNKEKVIEECIAFLTT